MRKLTYYVATSVDGFIGDPTGDGEFFTRLLDPEYLEWMAAEYPETIPTHVRAALGLTLPEGRHFDAVIQGRGSYEVGLKEGVTSPFAHLAQYVASRSLAVSPDPAVEIVSGDVAARVRELKAQEGLGIWLCGGADLAGQLADEIDEFVIKTYPLFLGSGMPMSRTGFALRELTLQSTKAFGNGATVSTYARKR
ncbi:dihydrofolate reductase family protein [Streptomyces sp. 12297]|uniref:dihydrofolate reductase family protein n=1 Tax=Streptomyces sp. NBC_00239 TaxID=2903640 RepID=UPI002E2A249E|nr:dihydrofolate reductase family protein [Streptomyces sp. NBC_00239]